VRAFDVGMWSGTFEKTGCLSGSYGEMSHEETPEFQGAEVRECLVVPAQMRAAALAEGQSPLVTRKPGMFQGGGAQNRRTGAGEEGQQVAANAGRVDKDMPVSSTDFKDSV
jgi:hypothetical protein